jgi:hypothetical protein
MTSLVGCGMEFAARLQTAQGTWIKSQLIGLEMALILMGHAFIRTHNKPACHDCNATKPVPRCSGHRKTQLGVTVG